MKNKFNCHSSIPFEVVVLENEPYVFLVCSTEGSVRQYDIREKTSCNCSNCDRDVIIHLPFPIQSMDIPQTRSYECALAVNNGCVHFYDRRKVFCSAKSHDYGNNAIMFQYDARKSHPGILTSGFTSLKYSKDGSELLCNYVGERVVVISCDFSEKMGSSHILVSRPECFSRTCYFDASNSSVKKEISKGNRIKKSVEDETNGTKPHPIKHKLEYFNSQSSLSGSDLLRSRTYNNSKLISFIPRHSSSYTGHSNVKTMLKEAIFWGKRYVMAGSDCGHVFIWDRMTEKICQILVGDKYIVNSLDHHPLYPVLACSGIDSTIKIFSATSYNPSSEEEINQVKLLILL
uniref:DDB1-and CUL4-associated factor 6 (Trinotate prediction) n=1 Tax=Henneguya salminicola TaxID=69463 RepID=A0A6G3MEH5_HENSL